MGRYPSSKQWDQRQDSGLDSTASRTPLILWRWPSGDPFAWSVLFRLSGRRFSCYLGKLHLVLPFWLGEVIVINQKSDERGNPSTITQIILWPSITSRLPSVKPEASYLNHRFARRNWQRQSQRVPLLTCCVHWNFFYPCSPFCQSLELILQYIHIHRTQVRPPPCLPRSWTARTAVKKRVELDPEFVHSSWQSWVSGKSKAVDRKQQAANGFNQYISPVARPITHLGPGTRSGKARKAKASKLEGVHVQSCVYHDRLKPSSCFERVTQDCTPCASSAFLHAISSEKGLLRPLETRIASLTPRDMTFGAVVPQRLH